MRKLSLSEKIVYTSTGFVALSIGVITTWEVSLREPVQGFFESETISVERATSTEAVEETRIDFLMQTQRAVEAGEKAKVAEAKKMRLEEIAEEAKTLQESIDPSFQ